MNPTPNAREAADHAVLDAALDEELGGAGAPDLWARVSSSLQQPQRSADPRRRWLAVAIIAAAAIVIAVAVEHGRHGEPKTSKPPTPAAKDPGDPKALVHLQALLAESPIAEASVRALAVWSPTSQRSILLAASPLEGMFEFGTSPRLPFAPRGELAALLAKAAPTALADAPIHWEHEVALTVARERASMMVRSAPTGREYALATATGMLGLQLGATADALLGPECDDATARTIAARGIVLGDRGFAAVPADSKRLRMIDVAADLIPELARFPGLQAIDVREAPEWHRADVLRQLAARSLRSLTLAGSQLGTEGTRALGALTSLRELHLLEPNGLVMLTLDGSAGPVAGPLAEALAHLPQLEQLTLASGNFADADLAQLAALTNLQELGLLGCRIEGPGFAALAGLPLRRLAVNTTMPFQVGALASLPYLETLFLQAQLPAAQLAQIQRLDNLRRLELRPRPAPTDDDLGALHGALQLTRLDLLDATAVTPEGRAALEAALPQCRVSFDELR